MAGSSTLDPDNLTPSTGAAGASMNTHGTGALGPSDLSDTGSDTMGGPGLLDADVLGLDRGTNEDSEGGDASGSAGASVGDLDLDADSDSSGTGERIAAGQDPSTGSQPDIGFDRVVSASEAGLGTGLDQAEEAQLGMTDEELHAAANEAARDELADDSGDLPGTEPMSDDDALLDQPLAEQDGVEAGYGDDSGTRG